MNACEIARASIAAGDTVIPILPGEKRAFTRQWPTSGINDPARIPELFPESKRSYNVGVVTGLPADGGYLVVLDLDVKHGKDGVKKLQDLASEAGAEIPETRTVRTPSGGLHLYFIASRPIGSSPLDAKAGIDVRGVGGQVLAPGSTIDGKPYVLEKDLPRAPLPDWIDAQLKKAPEKKAAATVPVVPLDMPSMTERAIHYLLHEAPPAIEGEGGDTTTLKVAARLKDIGVSDAEAIGLMVEHYNPRCEPPWMVNDISRKVQNAFRHCTQNAPGSAAPEAVFKPITTATEPTPTPSPAKSSLHFELFHTVTPELDRPALVEGWLERGAMSVVYGESNSGKTFFTLDMMLHVALAQDWHGRRVQGGAVIYVAAEGGGAIRKRLAAFRKHHGLDGREIPFALVPCPVNLLNPKADTAPLIELIASVERATGAAPACVVVDTLSRALGGGNENASDDMGTFVCNVDRIRSATGAHLLIVHHSGKDKAKGARGHSSLRAATDTEIEIADQIARATKQRDMEAGRPIGFELVPVEIGQDSYGAAVTSCIVRPRSLTSAQAFGKRIAAGSVAAEALAAIENLSMAGKPAPLADCRDEFIRLHEYDRKKGRDYFRRGMKALQDAGRIEMKGSSHVALVE